LIHNKLACFSLEFWKKVFARAKLSKKKSRRKSLVEESKDKAHVYEVVVSELGLRIHTKNAMRTLSKLAGKGFNAYVKWDTGWILVTPDDVEELIKEGKTLVPFMLEPPTFRGTKAYQYITVYKEDLENL